MYFILLAVAALAGYYTYKNWDSVKAFFKDEAEDAFDYADEDPAPAPAPVAEEPKAEDTKPVA